MSKQDFFRDISTELSKWEAKRGSARNAKPMKIAINNLKMRLAKKHSIRQVPTDIEIMLSLPEEDARKFRLILQSKPMRSGSGVNVIAVMTKPRKCPHGRCITCPGGPGSEFGDVPQSYTGAEPATRRGARNRYDAYLQVWNRLEQYLASGHIPEKIELIIMGGTFPAAPKRYRQMFISDCFAAMNDFSSLFFDRNGNPNILRYREFFELPGDLENMIREKNIRKKALAQKKIYRQRYLHRKISDLGKILEKEQVANETAKVRCIGMTIETRPDFGKKKQGNDLLALGCTRVELGMQSVYDEALQKMERGHTVQDTSDSIRELKDLGFKINLHYMPGLFVSEKKDLAGMQKIFSDERFRPDMLKLYPCMVMPGTGLHELWKKGRYKPLSTKKAADMIAKFKGSVPSYCRIMRVQRDIPSNRVAAGVDRTNLRQYVEQAMVEMGISCRCIRCREPKETQKKRPKKISIKVMHYKASMGNEFFISAEDKDCLHGFCRLRFVSEPSRPEITDDSAVIRELHVYGVAQEIGKKGVGKASQHKGLGKALLAAAEDIAKTYYKDKIVVISGVGARQYYRKLGYKRQGPYMVKEI